MIAWLAANWPTIIAGLIVLAIVIICLRNLFGKHKVTCCGNCAQCGGCAGHRKAE